MAVVRVRVARALHNRQPALIVERLHAAHHRAEADGVSQGQHFAGIMGQHRPGAFINWVGVGNDRVEAVVTAGELNDNQRASGSLPTDGEGVVGDRVGPNHFGEPGRHGKADSDSRSAFFDKIAAGVIIRGHLFFLSEPLSKPDIQASP